MAKPPHVHSGAPAGGTPMAEGYLEQLIASINDSARTARTAMTTLLVVIIYLGAACLAGDHEALLREGAMTIPQVGVSLPLVSSFALAPPILLFLHLTLLIQIDLLAGKLGRFRDEMDRVPARVDRQAYRLLIFPFAFAQTHMDGRNRLAHWPMGFISWLALSVLPLIVLLIVLVRFLPYQEVWLTTMHQCWVLLDVVLIWYFHWRRHPYPDESSSRSRFSVRTRRTAHVAYRWILFPCLIIAFGFAVFQQAAIPKAGDGDVRRETPTDADDVANVLDWACYRLGHLGEKEKKEEKDDIREPHSKEFSCRYLNLTDRTLVQREAPRGLVNTYADDDDKLREARQKHADGLFLRGRQLRYADLRRSNLFRADLIGADLRHARLDQAGLTRAVLRDARMDNIALRGAVMNEARLTNARLNKASMGCINVKIPNPQLANTGSGSSCTQLKGANLFRARLQGANLYCASLQGADLRSASLQGANLRSARLQGADLRQLIFKPLGTKEVAAIRKVLKTAIKNEGERKRVIAGLKSGTVSGAAGHPTGLAQSVEKTEIFMENHPVFARWKTPRHKHDEAKYFALLAPQLASLACSEPGSAPNLARRAVRGYFGAPFVTNLAAALLEAPCFKDLKLPDETVAKLKKERARQVAAKAEEKPPLFGRAPTDSR